MKIRCLMKCFFVVGLLALMIASAAPQLYASVDTSGNYQDPGLALLFSQDLGSDSPVLLAHYTGWRHRHVYRGSRYRHGYRGYYHNPPPPRRYHHRRYRHYGPPPPPPPFRRR